MKRVFECRFVICTLFTLLIFVGCGTKDITPTITHNEFLNEQISSGIYMFSSLQVENDEAEELLKVKQNEESPTHEVVVESESKEQESENLIDAIQKDSVLHLIPESTLGVIYCPSLFELDDRINNVYSKLVPERGQTPELLSQFLAMSFDAGFESLAELEDIGLDLDRDFAVFISSFEPATLSAAIHVSDRDTIEQIILEESEGIEPIQYNDVTYWRTGDGEGNIAIFDDILVFSQTSEDCENIIDINDGQKNSISRNSNYNSFISSVANDSEHVYVYFHLQTIISTFHGFIEEELQSSLDSIQSDPDAIAALPFIEGLFDKITVFLNELDSYRVSVKIDETDVILSQFIQFSNDGKIQQELEKISSVEMDFINDLPLGSFLSGGVNGNSEVLFNLSKSILEAITFSNANESEGDVDDIKKQFDTIVQDFSELDNTFADEIAFSAYMSDSIIPDIVLIFDLKAEQKLKQYMDDKFLTQLENIIELLHDSADDPVSLSLFDDIQFGNSIMHNEVEIKTIIFPDFGKAFLDVDPEVAMLIPQEWKWSYAFSNNQFYFSIGGAEKIQAVLDCKSNLVGSLAESISFQDLLQKLGADNNILYGISPLTAAKNIISLMSNADSEVAASLGMFSGILDGIPETFSFGYALKVESGGIGIKQLLALGDFQQLIQTIVMLSEMEMMQ